MLSRMRRIIFACYNIDLSSDHKNRAIIVEEIAQIWEKSRIASRQCEFVICSPIKSNGLHAKDFYSLLSEHSNLPLSSDQLDIDKVRRSAHNMPLGKFDGLLQASCILDRSQ